jgi:hypothetical protein
LSSHDDHSGLESRNGAVPLAFILWSK